jgi:TRAP transporter TAXI family solute receptor
MDGLGLDAAKDFQPVYLERAGDGPAMVLDGRVAALWGGGAGWPGFATVAKSEKGARFVAPDADEIRRILAKHPFLKPVTQPAGSFAGQAQDIASVGSWSFVLARPALDDQVAYRIAKALDELPKLGAPPQQLVDTTAKNTAATAPVDRLHPGVARYLRESGLIRT